MSLGVLQNANDRMPRPENSDKIFTLHLEPLCPVQEGQKERKKENKNNSNNKGKQYL